MRDLTNKVVKKKRTLKGSLLSPILFLLYVNDLPNAVAKPARQFSHAMQIFLCL